MSGKAPAILYEGRLWKRGQFLRSWRLRYFVLWREGPSIQVTAPPCITRLALSEGVAGVWSMPRGVVGGVHGPPPAACGCEGVCGTPCSHPCTGWCCPGRHCGLCACGQGAAQGGDPTCFFFISGVSVAVKRSGRRGVFRQGWLLVVGDLDGLASTWPRRGGAERSGPPTTRRVSHRRSPTSVLSQVHRPMEAERPLHCGKPRGVCVPPTLCAHAGVRFAHLMVVW